MFIKYYDAYSVPPREKESIKMQCNSKEKHDKRFEIPLEQAAAVIDSNTPAVPQEKRKADANKPLYLKRI